MTRDYRGPGEDEDAHIPPPARLAKLPELGSASLPLDARYIYDPTMCGSMNAAVIVDAATWRAWFGARRPERDE